MSDNNRIHVPGRQPESEQPVNIQMGHSNGVVEMVFNPPITRMRLKPREARALAVSMLLHADQAEYPELKIEP
jgi:hypothetical protein